MSREVKVGNEWVRVAGRGKAEYGASHYQTGTVTIPANIATVQFEIAVDVNMPDEDYIVILQLQPLSGALYSTEISANRFSATRFYINASALNIDYAQTVKWQAFKLYSDVEYNELLEDVADLKSAKTLTFTTSSVVTNGSIVAYRVGQVVHVSLRGVAATYGTADTTLVSGLPKAVNNTYTIALDVGNTEQRSLIAGTDGTIKCGLGSLVNCWQDISYLTAE